MITNYFCETLQAEKKVFIGTSKATKSFTKSVEKFPKQPNKVDLRKK